MSATKQPKRSQTAEALSERVRELTDETRLRAWNELCEDVKVIDNALATAFMSGRAELAKLAKPRALTEEECKHLYHLVRVLFETNFLLQRHAEGLAQLVESWTGHFKGLMKAGREIDHYANFREPYEPEDDEVE